MFQIIKQTIGIDCSMETLDCFYGSLGSDLKQSIQHGKGFSNNAKGFEKLTEWAKKRADKTILLVFVVEATGVYHELLTNYLFDNGMQVSVVLPNRTSNFFRTTKTKTINDSSCARMITQFGLEKELDLWKKPQAVFNYLKQLTRERGQLIAERCSIKNQLHAESKGAFPDSGSVKRMKQRLKLIEKQVKEIEQEIKDQVEGNSELNKKVQNICTINGVALITSVTIIAETNGFDLIRNKKQLVSYAGLDVIEKQSGTSVRSKPRISRRGNRHIRKALYFPAFSAIKHTPLMKSHYASLIAKHGIKMKAAVAIQRKLLVLIYTLWKTNEPFSENYQTKKLGQQLLVTPKELDQVCS
jgi:transposase